MPFSCLSVTAAHCRECNICPLEKCQETESVFEALLIEWHEDAVCGSIGDSSLFLLVVHTGHCNSCLNSHFIAAEKLTSTMIISSFIFFFPTIFCRLGQGLGILAKEMFCSWEPWEISHVTKGKNVNQIVTGDQPTNQGSLVLA